MTTYIQISDKTDEVKYKNPRSVLEYSVDWSAWLVDDVISSSEWEVPSGLTETSNEATDTVTTVWLSGGVDGKSYVVLNHIVTAGGREEEAIITIYVRDSS